MSKFSLLNYPSPWPLPKFIYAYTSYVYTQEWSSVMLTFYIFKVLYVFLFYLDDGNHPSWFDGLGNLDTSSSSFSDIEPSLVSVVVGDFIFLSMGILLGKIQSTMINKGMFYSFVQGFEFKTVTTWKTYFKKLRKRRFRTVEDSNVVHRRESSSLRSTVGCLKTHGLWPLKHIFACDVTRYGCCFCFYGNSYEDDVNNKELDYVQREYECDRLKWAHRRFYWFYFVQALLLGTPCTVAYTVGANDTIRSGTVVYFLIQSILLVIFYFWNKHDHVEILRHFEEKIDYMEFGDAVYPIINDEDEAVSTTDDNEAEDFNDTWNTRFNAIYLCWGFTITFFSMLIIFKTSLNVSLMVVYAWCFSLIVWLIIYASYTTVEYFYPLIETTLFSQSWLILIKKTPLAR